MCYHLFLSTNSDEDLGQYNSDLIGFWREGLDEQFLQFLHYPHKWFVGSPKVCSCEFRHIGARADSLDSFSLPHDGLMDSDEQIEATFEFLKVVKKLLADGYQCDCVDKWWEAKPEYIREFEVDLSKLDSARFQFFEDYRFEFVISDVGFNG